MAKALLFTPITLGNVKLKNRIIMSPMCMYNSEPNTGLLDQHRYDHYVTRAASGVGAIVVEATAVTPEAGISDRDLGLWSDEQVAPLAKLVQHLKSYEVVAGIQLGHAGRKSNSFPLVAPSALAFSPEQGTPRALTESEIKDLVVAFTQAAQRAEQAGFAWVELHAAHGYLINQFLSPLANQRTDTYGGSLENRYRFLGEIIRSIKATTKIDIHVRWSGDEVADGGNSFEQLLQLMQWAQNDGVVFNDISSGGITPQPPQIFPGYQALLASKFAAAGLRVGAVGLLGEPDLAEYVLRAGDAEAVYLGRPLLLDPLWPIKAAAKLHDRETAASLMPLGSYVRGM